MFTMLGIESTKVGECKDMKNDCYKGPIYRPMKKKFEIMGKTARKTWVESVKTGVTAVRYFGESSSPRSGLSVRHPDSLDRGEPVWMWGSPR